MPKKQQQKPRPRNDRTSAAARAAGFRSGLEVAVAAQLKAAGVSFGYESLIIRYLKPPEKGRYCPDFVLPNGIIIETKGKMSTADRKRHKHIKAQHPDLDIRIVFSRVNDRISKQSKTTLGKWAEYTGIPYADKLIPAAWLREKPNKRSLAAIQRLLGEK